MTPRALCALAALVVGIPALADEGEGYAELAFAPAILVAGAPTGDPATGTRPLLGAELLAYYGLTHTLHLGLDLGVGYASDLRFATAAGLLYSNVLTAAASGLIAYRLDTGSAWAPVGRIEAGLAYARYSGSQYYHQSYATPASDSTELAFALGVAVAAEYRLGDHLVGSLGVHARRSFGRVAWSIAVPLSFGLIW
jgi:hypothetical protein